MNSSNGSIKDLLRSIKELKGSHVKKLIDHKIREFKKVGKGSSEELFKELCFCILTANFNAERAIKIQKEIGNGFLTLSEEQLARRLKKLGYRYPNSRARYIVEARRYKGLLKSIIKSSKDGNELRRWLVKNIRGIGYKEASHFLRNIGYDDFAIIDFHILDLLVKHQLVKRPRTMTKRRYIEIEKALRKIAKILNLSLAELDMYLWYMETGKVLK